MATTNFLYRSTKPKSFLNIRLLYRYNNKDYILGAKTKLEVTKNYWEKQHDLKRVKDFELINLQNKVKKELAEIETFILNKFQNTNPININKEWLVNQIETYYNPIFEKKIPVDLLNYIDVYKDYKKSEIKESTVKKINVVANLLKKYNAYIKHTTLIKEIDLKFNKDFEEYCLKEAYGKNTITRAVKTIVTICKHARSLGLEVSYQLESIKPKYEKVDKIYLSFDELKKIEDIEQNKLSESYENAKDWLIISCYCGQRVSDFMRFTKDMIRYEERNGELKPLIEFTQHKTEKLMTVPLNTKIIEILNKRGGEFPRSISEQKYNLYIKQVCKIAGLNTPTYGGIKKETVEGNKQFRKVKNTYEKWELVTSHIGRKSFSTNHYGIIPTTFLIYVTGHSSESMFLNYIGKSNKDLAMSITDYF
jgi:Phage integrase SAM-like domain/Phage integrase family